VAAAFLALACAATAGCGGGEETGPVRGDLLTVYSSLPRHGISAETAEAVFAGQRAALEAEGGMAGRRRLRLVRLDATDAGDELWDPDRVSANAERAAEDPTAVAYLGELDYGGGAVSVPVTSAAGLLQLSPADGLASLTRRVPGNAREGPERYYPEGRRTYASLVPDDVALAEELVDLIAAEGARTLAIVVDKSIYGRELASATAVRARRAGVEPVETVEDRDDPEDADDLARDLADERPGAVVYAGTPGEAFGPLLEALGAELPDAPVWGASGLEAAGGDGRFAFLSALLPPQVYAQEGRALLARLDAPPAALYGYESMRAVLDAVERGGASRAAVARAALSDEGAESPNPGGARFALYHAGGGERTFERAIP
jgi:branched-chain amino acid transport system substrate-binding protein